MGRIDVKNLGKAIGDYLRTCVNNREPWKGPTKYMELLSRAQAALGLQAQELDTLRDTNRDLESEIRVLEQRHQLSVARLDAEVRRLTEILVQGAAMKPLGPVVIHVPADPIGAFTAYCSKPRSPKQRAIDLRGLVGLVDEEARQLRIGAGAEVRFVHSRQSIVNGGDESIRVEIKQDL